MKTTIELSDSVLRAAKATAAREGTTVRALVEEGLRKVLAEHKGRPKFKLELVTFRGEGLQLGIAEGGWEAVRELIHEFLAVATHPRIFYPPTPLNISLDFVGTLLKSPSVEVLSEGPDYWALLNSLLRKAKVTGPKVHDARIAAFCLHHRVSELWTADRDFGRFPELATRNPLVA